MPSRKRSEPQVWDYGADRLTSATLNEPGYGGRVRSRRDRELLLKQRRAGGTPRHLIGLHRGAETFKITRRQLHARRGQGWIVTQHLLIRGLADEYAAPPRSALQAAG